MDYFIEKLKNQNSLIEEKNIKIIKYNAFRHDNFSDPLISLLGELLLQHEDLRKHAEFKASCLKLITGSYNLLKNIMPSGVQAGLNIAEAAASVVSKKTSSPLDTFIDFNEIKQDFSNKLAKLSKEGQDLALFFIDELDRCSPPFTIRLFAF